ncbi:hypothetical protein BX589_1423 [Paraburkholderia fungorum]|jgi:hypothetical protein|nr:hypothetical protein BX589_1423 [Paraburkholderia fungorum]
MVNHLSPINSATAVYKSLHQFPPRQIRPKHDTRLSNSYACEVDVYRPRDPLAQIQPF